MFFNESVHLQFVTHRSLIATVNSVDAIGYSVITSGHLVDATGYSVDVIGYSVGTSGYSVDAIDYSDDTTGHSVSTIGYSVDANGCLEINFGDCKVDSINRI